MAELVFWAAAGLASYVYLAFPLLLVVRASLRPRPVLPGDDLPTLSVVIAARNEQASIVGKLDSILANGYPASLLEIIVSSDGSTDGTEAIVESYSIRGVRLLRLPRAGKAAALGAAVEASRSEILVFTDANGELDAGALRALVRPFADQTVGGVAGDQQLLTAAATNAIGAGERRYWAIERLLKHAESRAGDVVSATGGLYAIRRGFYEPIPPGVTDDAFLSMGVVAKRSRVVLAPDAIVREELAATPGLEVRRKSRIITRGLRTIWMRRGLLNPFRYGFYAIELWSHKVLRRLMPIPLTALLVTSALLYGRGSIFAIAAIGQVTFYGAGVLGLLLVRTKLAGFPLLSFPAHFCAANAAATAALANLVRGRSIEAWEPRASQRPSDAWQAPLASRNAAWPGRVAALLLAGAVGVITGAQGPLIAGVVGAAACLAVVALRPDLAFLSALALLYSNAIVLAVSWHGAPSVVMALLPGLFLIPLVEHLVIRRERLLGSSALPFIGAFAIVQAVSAIQATDGTRALLTLVVFLFEGVGIYIVVINVVRSREMFLRALRVLLAVAVLLTLLMAVKVVTGNATDELGGFAQARVPPSLSADPSAVDELARAQGGSVRQTGPLEGPNRFGQYLLPLIPAALLFVSGTRVTGRKLLWGTAGVIVLIGIALTFSRGAFIALAVCAVALVGLRVLRTAHFVAGVAVLAVFLALTPSYRERVLSIADVSGVLSETPSDADSSIEGRFTENAAAFYMFLDHPILGVGPGNFPLHYRPYANLAPANVRSGERHAHNLYLGVAAETGILGAGAILGVFAMALWELLRARKRATDEQGRRIASVGVVIVISLMTTSMFLHLGFVRYFWLFMALAAVAARVASTDQGRRDHQAGRVAALEPVAASR